MSRDCSELDEEGDIPLVSRLEKFAALPLTPPSRAMLCSPDHNLYEAQFLGRIVFAASFRGHGQAPKSCSGRAVDGAGVAAGKDAFETAFGSATKMRRQLDARAG